MKRGVVFSPINCIDVGSVSVAVRFSRQKVDGLNSRILYSTRHPVDFPFDSGVINDD